jgi:OOP family OmpA-OmpF porin
MKKKYIQAFWILLLISLLAACAAPKPSAPFTPMPVDADGYAPKVDNFVIVLDASSSMEMLFEEREKFSTAKDIVDRMNQTIPEMKLKGALLSFGHAASVTTKNTEVFYGLDDYVKSDLAKGLAKLTRAGGTSPLNRAIDDTAALIKAAPGKTAVIIISDGSDMGPSSLAAAQKLKQTYGDNLCLYTIQVGDDPAGRKLLEAIAKTTACGGYHAAGAISSGQDMADFVRSVFVGGPLDKDGDGVTDDKDQCPDTPRGASVDMRGCPPDSDMDGVTDLKDKCPQTPAGVRVDARGCPLDSDADGVTDDRDQCPDTAKGLPVDARGCPIAEKTGRGTMIFRGIQFETNKATLTAASAGTIVEIANSLKFQPGSKLEIQGHTDDKGSRQYNLMLSEKRDQAVKEALVENGVAAEQLTSKGYGPDQPLVSNDTASGRAQNRRVEFKPIE